MVGWLDGAQVILAPQPTFYSIKAKTFYRCPNPKKLNPKELDPKNGKLLDPNAW